MSRLFHSLRTRLLLLVALALAPAVGLMVYTAAEQRQHAIDEAQHAALRAALTIANEHWRWVDVSHGLLDVLSDVPAFQSGNPDACEEILAEVHRQHPSYTVLGLVDKSGARVCSTADGLPSDASGESWFQEALATKSFVVSNYQANTLSGKPSIVFAQPVIDTHGEVVAVLAAPLTLDWIDQQAERSMLPPGSSLTIIDGAGTVLARHPDNIQVEGSNVASVPIVAYALQQDEETVANDIEGLDGRQRLYGIVPSAGREDQPELYVIVGIPESYALAPANVTLKRNLVILGLVAVLGFGAAWVVGDRSVLRHVRRLVSAADGIARGDLSVRTNLSRDGSDLGMVAAAFDDMAASLQERDAERAQAEAQRLALAREQAARLAAEAAQQRGAVLYRVSKALLEGRTIIEAASMVLREAGETLSAEAGAFWTYSDVRQQPRCLTQWRSPCSKVDVKEPPFGPSKVTPGHGRDEAYAIALTDEPDDGAFPSSEDHAHAWVVHVPIKSSRTMGCMEFLCPALPPEPDEMWIALTTVGRLIGQFLERRQAELARDAEEKRLRTVVETSPVAVVMVEAGSGNVLHTNREWERITGRPRDSFRTTDHILTVGTQARPDGSQYQPEELPLARALSGERVLAEEVTYVLPDGRRVPTLASAAPVKSEAGSVTAAVLVLQDMTKLHEVERMRSEFMGMVGHELRTPLAIIKMTAQATMMDNAEPTKAEVHEAFRTINDQVDRLLSLVSNLRDVAQAEAGVFSVDAKPGELAPVVAEARQATEQTFRARVELDVPGALPRVHMDHDRVLQVLLNLLANAVRFSPPEVPVRVTVRPNGDEVVVSVTNRGPGIPVEKQRYLFRKFSKLQSRDGTGLGLAICKGIVEAHGGRIWVESAADAPETTFSFTLPAVLEDAKAEQSEDGSPAEGEGSEAKRVLLVDDEPVVLRHLSRMLERAGLEPVIAQDTSSAIERAQSRPDLIVMDMHVAEGGGVEVLERLRQVTDAPVIFLSASASPSDVQEALAAGARDYVVKPFEPADIMERIESALENDRTAKGAA